MDLAVTERLYEWFIREAGAGVACLSPLEGENAVQIASQLAVTATRLGANIRIWIDEGQVYFVAIDRPLSMN